MRKVLLIVLFSTFSFAGFYVNYDIDGNVTGYSRKSTAQYKLYYSDKDQASYDAAKTLLQSEPIKHLKVVDSVLVKKDQADIDSIIATELQLEIDTKTSQIDLLNITVS